MPQVSIVIPTHNRATLLRRAVLSALGQTYEDLEVVVADDASSDGTADLIRSLADRRITYVRHEVNQGVSISRNTAIARARGEYIAFLDDDDEWCPEKLERQMDRMRVVGGRVSALCCGHYEIESSTNRILREIKPWMRGQVYESMLTQGFFNHTSTILVRTACFQTVGLFDPAFRYGEDFDMWLRLARVYEFDFEPGPLVKLYFQPGGLTQNYAAIISGAELHLSKHLDFFERHPRLYSDRLHKLATYYCFLGDVRKGREIFRRAVALDPRFLKSYVGYALSLAGSDGFKQCYIAKDRIVRQLSDLLAKSAA